MRLAETENESSDETTASVADSTESSSVSGTTTTTENDVTEERFRVDRRKLEQMLEVTGETEGETADDFFHRIMEETSTVITWPTKLKVGAKSKKDPHIKITGQQESVQMARESILQCLDTKRNRVTLKMDVSFTDHSHIIGKGGHNIQHVMEETGCHIHFPDSNRNAVGEKSNQVSIAGQPVGVDQAKSRIRELLPMVVMFDLPLSSFLHSIPDTTSPALQLIQHTYSFTVTMRPKSRGGPISVVVRGSRRQVNQLRQGLPILIGYLTGGQNTMLPVTMSLEIPPQHHSFVMGRGNSNIQNIMRDTGANIVFPDPAVLASINVTGNFVNGLRKSTVLISGHFDSVYLAWQEIMGYLPLVLLFDLKEAQELDTALVTSMMDHLDLNIVIRPKPKQNTKSILVRGYEKASALLFDVRQQLLQVDHSDLPSNPPSSFVRNMSRNETEWDQTLSTSLLQELTALRQDIGVSASNSDNHSGSFPAPPPGNSALLPWIISQLTTNAAGFYGALVQAQLAQKQISEMSFVGLIGKALKDLTRVSSPIDQASSYPSSSSGHASSLSSPSSSPCDSPIFMSSDGYTRSSAYGGSSSNLSTNTDNCDHQQQSVSSSWNSNYWLGENPDYSEMLNIRSPYDLKEAEQNLATMPEDLSAQARGGSACDKFSAIGSERRSLESDYMQKRLLASKAINEPVSAAAGARIPTDFWSGCGFSKSMPQQALRAKLEHSGVIPKRNETLPEMESGACGNSTWSQGKDYPEVFSASNYLENFLPRPSLGVRDGIRDLTQLFSIISLEKYLDIFRQQQVDLATFLTLNEQDLQELGIPYSARRRMLLAISELQSSQEGRARSFHAAPGAERRAMFSRQAPMQTNSVHSNW